MKLTYIFFFGILLIFFSCQPDSGEKKEESEKWVSLFNGQNLDGWAIKINGHELGENYANTFRVEDSLLKISYDEYENYGTNYGAIFTEKSFTNYRLRVEYRFVGDTAVGAPNWGFRDSGVQYHCQSAASMEKDQPFPVCLEYNFHGGDGTNERPTGQICALGTALDFQGAPSTEFCVQPEVKRTFHGDQWVTAEVEVKGDTITHWVNGEKILTFTNPRYNPEHEYGKNFIQGAKNELRSGHISFQSNSHPIQFRRVEILEYL
ncbi:MAG: DUF1080 domain-containing protein [Bacteroidetes bacterium]|nr:DUF1080 domain-containing protein [Bacteroidota bacterium]